jgi:uncharacterized membrane protein YagU involved in acid resistance
MVQQIQAQAQTQAKRALHITQNNYASLLQGALAGFVATLPMTLFMLAMHQLLPKWQQYALPPEKITDEMAERADVKKHMDKPQRVGAALVAHFGYGTTMGVIYSMTVRRLPLPAVPKGILWGLIVWVGSYFGISPALGIAESGYSEPWRRNLLMIAAHVVWGASLGAIAHRATASAPTPTNS